MSVVKRSFAVARAREIFDALPMELRREFNQSPSEFFEFANDPKNADKLGEVLPQIAEPGKYFPTVLNNAGKEPAKPSETDKTAKAEPEPKEPEKTVKTEITE